MADQSGVVAACALVVAVTLQKKTTKATKETSLDQGMNIRPRSTWCFPSANARNPRNGHIQLQKCC